MQSVEWIHPSVRDLVIEHLVTHDADRADFLRKASTDGLVLALSTAGGRHGDRALPLLRKDDDWRALRERASEVATFGDVSDDYKLLEAFEPAVRHSRGQTHQNVLASVLAEVLAALHTRWDETQKSISWVLLRPYCVLSEATEPLVPLPDLRATWRTVTADAKVDGDPPERPEADDLVHIDEWLRLAWLVARYEPRLLRQVRFSERYRAFLAAVVGGVAGWLDEVVAPEPESDDETGEPSGLTSEHEEIWAIVVALEDPLRTVSYLVSSLAAESDALAQRCSALNDEFAEVEDAREAWHEQQAEAALENWEPDQTAEDGDEEDDSSEPTIEEMFADL
jgi:hypothetical protein